MNERSAKAAVPRQRGYAQLALADKAWDALQKDGRGYAVASRSRPNPPYIFSIELLNAGRGESILMHYGTPDATSLVMINGGSRAEFRKTVEARLRSLKERRFAGAPTPIELFVASDQDADKVDGLFRMLQDATKIAAREERVVEIRRIWANIFASYGLRGEIRGLMEKSGIPRNWPFDHLVMRLDRGHLTVPLPGGLEIVVLGPDRIHLNSLYEATRRSDERQARR